MRVYHIAPDMMEYNSQIISQPTNCFRAALDENGAPIMILLPNPSGNDPDQYRLWCGGDRLSLLQLGQWHRYYSAWTLGDINDGWDAFTSLTIEDTYTQRVYPPAQDLGVTEAERDKMFFCGTTPVVVSGVGSGGSSYPIECGFDADHFLTRIDYPDSTFEEYEYNDFKQVTRHRDRKGNVQLWVYDSAGNLLEHKVGLKEVSGSDVQQAEYAVYEYEYYSTPAALKGNLKTAFSPLHTSETDLYRTDYEYLTNGQLETIIESADVASGTRPETTFTYNSLGQVATVTDPEAHTTTYTDDYLGRLRRITYHDSSSDYAHFGTSAAGLAGQVIWTKDRMDVVTSFTYDDLYRVTDTLVGSHTADSSNNLTAITDVTQQRSTSTAYIGTTRLPQTVTTDGKYTLYDYDFRHRLIKTRRWPHANQVLQTRTVYDNYNRVFYTEDPYERREYMGYSATNEPSLIRRVQANHAGYTLADNAAVLAVTRSTSANAAFTVVDAIKDASGNLEEVIDARGISTTYVYDSRDRETSHVAADGTSVAAQTDTIYNKASQVTEVRSPRYFDSGDAQDEYMRTLFTYTGRGLQKTQQVAPGASWFADATTSTTYTLDGKVATTTDALTNVWTTHHDNGCCGHFVGSEDPLGHGSMTYSDNMGRAYHGVSVSDYDTHSGSNPTDVKTLSEWTTRFDNLGRSVARTQWLVAQSTIDPLAVRIAGLDSISASDGITTLTFYDNNIGDGVGLDSTGGMTLPKLGGGTYSLSLEGLLDILADTEANGGANTTFDDGVSAGSAVVSIAPTEEISVSISDATGRTVLSAQLQAHNGTTPLAIINWSSQVYDQEVNISGFGDVIETRSVNRAGKLTKSRSDASGRVLESYDQLDKKSWSEYDPAGNITKSRDPNGVGFDATYDELGRMLTQTDTFGDMTESVYDKEGNVVEQIDAKGNSTFMVYDAQNRRRTVTDRLSGVTTYALNAGGQLTALTDAESQTTSYTYNARGEKTEEEYPDHTSGSPGDATYGKILFTYDPAGRLSRRDDQNGDTVTHVYDMAGRLLQKDYRTRANSPTGTIADSDTFTYDRSSRMLTAVSGRYSNTVTNTYDVAGRLKDESLTIATKTYTVSRTYDSLGRLFQMTYPNSTVVERTYTDRNQLYTVKYGSNIEDTRSYDDGGRLSTSAYRNGVTTTYNYRDVSGDKDNLLASIQFAHPGGTATNRQVGDLTYTWDANKNKTKETIAGTLSGYSFDTTLGADPDGYDDEDRITYFKRSNTTNPQTWTLTSVGDWSSWNNFSTTAETRTHGAAHELTRIGSGTTPATILYDTKGNITQNQRTPGTSSTYQNYVWDFDNRMISADTNGDNTADVTYEYDALGRRVARTQGATAVVYIHAGQQTVCDYTRGANANTTPAFRYVWGDYIDEPILRQTGSSTLLYYHHNQQYSTVAITNSSGEVISRYGYTAFGEQSILTYTGSSQSFSSYGNRYTFTGREWDDSLKAHYFRARWYDAALGRFVNRDPIGYVDGMSLYGGYFILRYTDANGTDLGCHGGCPQVELIKPHVYGCFCGPRHPPDDFVGPLSPIDPLDNCCLAHDSCYSSCGPYLKGEDKSKNMSPECLECDRAFCRCLRTASCNRHPSFPKPPRGYRGSTRENCEKFKQFALVWFDCEFRFGVSTPRLPNIEMWNERSKLENPAN